MYDGDNTLRYVLFVEHVMLPIIMGHHMVKQIGYIYINILYVEHIKLHIIMERYMVKQTSYI